MTLSRRGWVLTSLALASVALIGPDTAGVVSRLHGQSFPDALVALGSLVQLAISCVVLLTVALAAIGGTSGLFTAVTPGLLRRALFVGAAGALAITPVGAEELAGPREHPEHSVSGLRLPDRPIASAPRLADPASVRPAAIVVQRGDTLWAIAARGLPDGATVTTIAEECARWHAANRSTIGDDPDLIHPRQHLTPPTPEDPS